MSGSWKKIPIQELVEPIETCNPRKAPDEPFTYIDVSSVSRSTHSVSDAAKLKGAEAPSRARRRVRAGDVVFATIRPTLHRIAQIASEFDGAVCSTGFFVLRPKAHILSRYLFFWLQGAVFNASMRKLQRGASYPAVSDSDVRRQVVSVPPIGEQERIVAIVDEAFAGIETAIANTEKNLANAKEIFESQVDSLLKSRSGAVELRLADCVEKVSTGPFGSLLHKSDYVSRGIPLVNPVNIQGPRIIADDCKRVGQDTLARLSAYILEEGDLVVARRGEIGRCAVVREAQSGWICGTGCFIIKPGSKVDPDFLANLLRSPTGRSSLEGEATGATMKSLGNRALSNFKIRLPPKEVQEEIVDKISDLHDLRGRLDAICSRKLAALAELQQSILQKAFSGELTADSAEREVKSAAV